MNQKGPVWSAAAAALLALSLVGGGTLRADSASDDRVRQRIQMRLAGQVALRIESPGIEVQDGTVRLTGNVASLGERNRAARLAGGIVGVRTVVNDLIITPSGRSDAAIAEDVHRELDSRPRFAKVDLQVSIAGGEVTLEGVVERAVDRLDAEEIAADVRGVRGVVNRLQVRAGDYFEPESLRSRVMRSLTNPLTFDLIRQLDVSVEDGTVILRGLALRESDRLQAERLALGVPGVLGVINRIALVEGP